MRSFTFTTVAIIAIIFCQSVEPAAGDIVVNVNSRENGSPGVFGADADVEQFLAAGDYTFELVNNIASHANYHADANFTAWSYHQPGSTWGTNYNFAYDDNDSGNDVLSSPPFAGPDKGLGGNFTNSPSPLEAFDATSAARRSFQVHIPFDQTVGFYFSDSALSDNAGGVSIRISSSPVPEPAAVGTLALLGVGLLLRRRRRQCT